MNFYVFTFLFYFILSINSFKMKSLLTRKNCRLLHPRFMSKISESSEKTSAPRIIFVLGGPGAGKGTQCEKLSREFSIPHLSAGELLRNEIKSGSDLGRQIDSYLINGNIVPVDFSLNLLEKNMQMINSKRYLIDGFPRNWDNLMGWNTRMNSKFEVEMIIFIDCTKDILIDRIKNRSLSSGRSDDDSSILLKRFKTFESQTVPVVQYFEEKLKDKFCRINGNNDVNTVYKELKDAFLSHCDRKI